MGQYSYIFSVVNFLFPVMSVSLYSAYLRFESMYDTVRLQNFVFKLSLLSCLLFFLLLFALFDNAYYPFFAFIVLFSERLYYLRSTDKIFEYNIVNNGQKLILLLLVFNSINSLDSKLVILYSGISYLVMFAFSWGLHRVKKTDFDTSKRLPEYTTIVKFCFTSTLMTLVSWVNSFSDQVIIKYYYGFEALAPYSVAFRMVATITLLAGVFISYYPVMYYKEMDKRQGQTIYLFQNGFFLLLALLAALFIVFRDFIYFLFGAEKYSTSSEYLAILIAAEVFRLIASIFMTYKTYKLQQFSIFKSLFLVSILNLILNMMLVPSFGVIAAAWSTLATYVFYFIISYFISYRFEKRFLKLK